MITVASSSSEVAEDGSNSFSSGSARRSWLTRISVSNEVSIFFGLEDGGEELSTDCVEVSASADGASLSAGGGPVVTVAFSSTPLEQDAR